MSEIQTAIFIEAHLPGDHSDLETAAVGELNVHLRDRLTVPLFDI
jgi:hypothetical protein